MDLDQTPTMCCPDQDRIKDVETRDGSAVADVHRHKGLLRGFILESGSYGTRRRLMHWLRNGRLTRAVEHPQDLRRVR
ncbi:hypothetical protein [Novosphingobium sp. EMRT-2]|uniref:hypothetical protein n=1 Tax=Novosphingobium sp. EMRT-2 TaxID=2571749 RepID=UPI0010BD18E7|nr:hypothetical protein [Novosphingobium sp. EMRT-2]QCI93370.1 hypothetical protein FA702_07255 [Novosphingobium sp. EMRT-2]